MNTSTLNARCARARTLRHRGFTMLEMLVVVGIIVLLAGLLFAFAGPMRERTRRAAAKKLVESTYNALEQYRLVFRDFPPDTFGAYTSSEALVYFLTTTFKRNPNAANGEVYASVSGGPFIQYQPSELMDINHTGRMSIIDPWKSPLKYVITKQTQTDVWDPNASAVINLPTLYSLGPNRIDDNGTNDDITLGK